MKRDLILAVESSCDDSAIAIVDRYGRVLASEAHSQVALHQAHGGVVPELASREHETIVEGLFIKLSRSFSDLENKIYAVAATCAPGLVGPLLVGAGFARGLATGWGLPFVGVHHLRGHMASVLLEDPAKGTDFAEPSSRPVSLKEKAEEVFPALLLLVSGGHTQLLSVRPGLHCELLMDSADDAAGECFDKCAKLMGLPYPGGPEIEKLAATLDRSADIEKAESLRKELPRPSSREGFSFAGLKSAVRRRLELNPELKGDAAFAWAIQEVVGDTFLKVLSQIEVRKLSGLKNFVFCGGVSANLSLRSKMQSWAEQRSLPIRLAPMPFCTDNAAMIAAAAWIQASELEQKFVSARAPLLKSSLGA